MTCPSCGAQNEGTARICSTCGRPLGPPQSLGPGSIIASRYEIQALLGSGGMGTVFRAHDRAVDETVAIKVLRAGVRDPDAAPTDELERGLDMARRFRSEVKLAWKVRHRNVCGIHEYGEDGDVLYISMELVEGHNLKQILRERGALLWEEAYDVALQTVEGLQAIHDVGVIHRDLKPGNLMRDAQGVVRLMDFGIAKVWQHGNDSGITGVGQIVGTPEYMSPEQVRGGHLDFRSDIYALGVVFYELFTGRVPFRADTSTATMIKHLEEEPPLEGPEAAQIPSALLPVLRQALAKKPSERYSTCRKLSAALEEGRGALRGQATDSAALVPPSQKTPYSDEPGDSTHASHVSLSARPPTASREGYQPEPHLAPAEARLLIPTLLRGLKHSDIEVRVGAAEALGSMGPDAKAAIPALADALGDGTPEVRAGAAVALGMLGSDARTAARPLLAAQADSDTRVRVAVADALARLGTREDSLPPPEERPPLPAADDEPPSDGAGASIGPGCPSEVTGGDAPQPTQRAQDDEGALSAETAELSGEGQPSSVAPITPDANGQTVTETRFSREGPALARRGFRIPPARGAVALAILVVTGLWVVSGRGRGVEPGTLVQLGDRGVVAPEALLSPTPVPPSLAVRLGVEGAVELRVLVDENGAVIDAEVVRGAKDLNEAAVASVKGWRYRPATKDGVPVRVWIPVAIRFELSE